MQPDLIVALIAAIATIIGAIIGATVGLRQNRIDRDKLQQDRNRLELELTKSKEQSRVWEAEVAKLKDEAAMLRVQITEIKSRPIKAERAEIRELLTLFERAAFRPMDGKNAGDPTAAFNGIQQTRIALQTRGASLITDKNLATQFRKIQDMLWELEQAVEAEYPSVVTLAAKWKEAPLGTAERIQDVRKELGPEKYEQAAIFIRAKAGGVYFATEGIHNALQVLDAKLAQLGKA